MTHSILGFLIAQELFTGKANHLPLCGLFNDSKQSSNLNERLKQREDYINKEELILLNFAVYLLSEPFNFTNRGRDFRMAV